MKKVFLASFLLALFALTAKPVLADQPSGQILSVSPAIIEAKIQKGSGQTYEITIKNLLREPLGISSALGGFQAQDEQPINPGTNPNDLSKWSSITPEQTIIEPGKTQTFQLKVKTPNNLKEGGYYEAALFTPFFSKPLQINAPTVLSKVGVIILGTNGNINYKDLAKKAGINSFGFDKLVYDKSQIDTVFSVSNSYFTHFDAKPFITVSPLLGASQRYELQDKRILPGKIRTWNENIVAPNAGIINKATLAVSVGQGNYIYKTAYFFILPIKPILAILIIIILALIFAFRGKQIRRALRIIQKGE